MEMNITKQTVTQNQNLFDQSVEVPLDSELALPDYCPDIIRVLKCRVCPKIMQKSISSGALGVEGVAFITLIYCDSQGKINSFEQEVDFQKIISLPEAPEGCRADVKICTDYVNCRAATSRKIEIHGVLALKARVVSLQKCEIITDIDCNDIQLKRGSFPATNPLGYAEKTVVIEEELDIGRAANSVTNVLRCDVRPVVEQCELVGTKAVLKGELIVAALYCTDAGSAEHYESRLPFTQIIDISTEGSDCKVCGKVAVVSQSLKPRTNLSGEAKSFAFECKLGVTVSASCENDVPVLLDAYLTKNEAQLQCSDVSFKKLVNTLNERYICKKSLEFSENTFGSVLDMWCENKVRGVKIVEKNLLVGGTVVICLLTVDSEGSPQYYERSVDFEYSKPLDALPAGLAPEALIETVSASYTILSETRLEAQIELNIEAEIYSTCQKKVITGIEISDSCAKKCKKAPVVVYFAEAGESLWEISKKYNACHKSLMELNSLSCDVLEAPAMLLVP